jgi:glycosyltransferase involved in cell wall biosynthesis
MRPRAIVVGPVPPPFHGCSVTTACLLESSITETFDVYHLDTSDRRSLDNLGQWDLRNIFLALKTLYTGALWCVLRRPRVVYIPISQNAAGFLRDALLIWCGSVLAGARVIVHLHGAMFREFYESTSAPMRWLIDTTMPRVQSGIVLGGALKGHLSQWIPSDRIAVVPNGTPCPSVFPTGRRTPGVTVVFLGNLLLFKGIADFTAVAADLAQRYDDLGFRYAGRWTYDPFFKISADQIRTDCLATIERSGRADAFEFVGELDRGGVRTFLQNADILVLPSYQEGLPLVLLEAMAAGIPVISSRNVGAIDDVVVQDVTGFLVEPGDRPALTNAIETLARDTDMRRRMGRAAFERCRSEFSMELWTRRLEDVFQDALEQRGDAPHRGANAAA